MLGQVRRIVCTAILVSTASIAARAQRATVVGSVVVRESGEPVTNASVSVLPNGAHVNDTVRVTIAMTRLALELPAVVVQGACTDRTPFEDRPAVLAALFDQVTQNAERLRLLARERPFAIEVTNTRGIEGRKEWDRSVVGHGTRARFQELVGGVPVLAEFEITNTFRNSPIPVVVQRSRVIGVRWLAPTTTRDTVRRPPR